MVPTSVEPRLLALRAHYTSLINAAVGAGRMDMVEDLANAYEDEALDLLLTSGSGPGGRSDRPAEILEIGSDWPSWRPTGWSNFFRFRCRRSHRGGENHARRH